MKNYIYKMSPLLLSILAVNAQALESLDDSQMSSVRGQAGITLDFNPGITTIGAITYTQDDVGLSLNDVKITGTPGKFSTTTIDIESDGRLVLDTKQAQTEFEIGSIGMTSSIGTTGEFMGIRGRTSDYNAVNGTGETIISLGDDPNDPNTYDLAGSKLGLFYDRLHFIDDNNEWILDDLAINAVVNYGKLVVMDDGLKFDFDAGDSFDSGSRGLSISYDANAVGMSLGTTPETRIGYDDDLTNTFGSVSLNLNAYGSFTLLNKGKSNQGITFIPAFTLVNDDDDIPAFKYTDDGFIVLAKNFTGDFSTNSGFTVDFSENDSGEPYIDVSYSDFAFAFNLEDLVLGGSEAAYDA
ncbi:MAG: hypothetical protein P1U57_11310, partial [Oleibacter sp.]|nr:hypothetical protein [Thalassolituus sp.]